MRWLLLLILLLPHIAYAATISGTVYDLSLDEATAIVTIDSDPEQRIVTKNGTYAFSLSEGSYTLRAATQDGEWLAEENITIREAGEYVVDLLLEPDFSMVDDLQEDQDDIPEFSVESSGTSWLALAAILGAIVLAALILLYTRRKKPAPEEDEFRSAVLGALKKRRGRATQRELRKDVPFSEAKVSLVLTELESEGKIKKIKKGRGNVIVLR